MNTPFEREGENSAAQELMSRMITVSQRPGEGNMEFVETIGSYLEQLDFDVYSIPDPDYDDRALLVVDIGDPDGEQILTSISHSDVVGIDGQSWARDPWKLTEENGVWYGRGVCDTHGSGVAMLIAAARPEITRELKVANKRISIIFTSDEEAASADLSYRGVKLAVGELGVEPIVTSKYFITGEPTEVDSEMIAMRAHKGRWLAHFILSVDRPGHAAEDVQNALTEGVEIVHRIFRFAQTDLKDNYQANENSDIFNPAYSTAQVTAADVKRGDYSTTPDHARFTVDLRTLPGVHEDQVHDLEALIRAKHLEQGVRLEIEEVDNFQGTVTPAGSPIVNAAEIATGLAVRGFNGGDEGEVLRRHGKHGITLGPGELRFAHAPNEQIPVASVARATEIYDRLFHIIVEAGNNKR